jgi:hypothetical protein
MREFFDYAQWRWRRTSWWSRSYLFSLLLALTAMAFDEPVKTYLFTAATVIIVICILTLFVQVFIIESWQDYKKEKEKFINVLKGK